MTTLKTEQVGRQQHTLLGDLVLADEDAGVIVVPAGTTTNFASLDLLHNVFLFVLFALVAGYGNYAATVHDWLYTTGQVSRKDADAVFYRALRAEGVARWRAWLFWSGVRLGGAGRYRSVTT
ncbi:DUF1353 domain-containing protein [Pseudomonas prosekii]|nr:DUF1353 domain-containing protein [Pseudomonas prosekii]